MKFESKSELFAAIDELTSAYAATHDVVAQKTAQAALYYEGLHWQAGSFGVSRSVEGRKLLSNIYNPDRADLRVTDNFITPLMLRLAAQTYPSSMEIECQPGDAGMTAGDLSVAQAAEDLLNTSIDMSSYLQAHRAANMGRTILGDYGIGLALTTQMRVLNVNGQERPFADRIVKAFAFPPTNVILDPFETSSNLRDHEIVIYKDVWTIHRLRREFGEQIEQLDPKEMKQVGQLAEFELKVNEVSGGKLFSQHRRFSKTPGAVVLQVHVKDETGRFGRMYVAVDGGVNNRMWINHENPESPFGGDGFPMTMLHANRREGTPWSLSDTWLVVDDQNRRNVLKTLTMRHIQRYSAFQWLIDERWFKGGKEEARAQLTNRVGGLILGRGGDRHNQIKEPQIAQPPAPSPTITDLMERERESAFEKVSRPDIARGTTKSHVPDSTFQTALEQANQIGQMRVQEDVESVTELFNVLLGTQLNAVRSASPSILSALRRRGFEPEDFTNLLSLEPNDPQVRVRVRQTSVRNRSHERRKADLDAALVAQAITPQEYRRAVAEDLDIPLTADDRVYSRNASRSVQRIIMGEEWSPIPLGDRTDIFLNAFRQGMFDRRLKKDPEAGERLKRALQSQLLMFQQEQALFNPQPQAPQQQAEAAPAGPQPGQSFTVADLLGAA